MLFHDAPLLPRGLRRVCRVDETFGEHVFSKSWGPPVKFDKHKAGYKYCRIFRFPLGFASDMLSECFIRRFKPCADLLAVRMPQVNIL
jgi:hypothetical protein